MNLYVKKSGACGCTFLGKGIVGHPEMGVVREARNVVLDSKDVFNEWTGEDEVERVFYRTDTGYVFDNKMLNDGIFEIELYASNIRKPYHKDAWGVI